MLPATGLEKVIHQQGDDKLFILAHVHAPADIEPSRVKRLEEALEERLAEPVELFIRNTLSKDVSAKGSINQLLTEGLDGFFYSKKPDQRIKILKTAEQTIREFLESRVELYVEDINLYSYKDYKTIAATVFGIRRLTVEEIRQLEMEIQRRTGEDNLLLALRHINVHLYDRWGLMYYEWAQFEPLKPTQESIVQKIVGLLDKKFENSDYFITNKDFSFYFK